MKYYAVRNLKDDTVCITNKKPTWGLFNSILGHREIEWLFTERKKDYFFTAVHKDVFKKLTGLNPPKEGKDGMIIVPDEKMKLIKLI